MQLSGSLKAIIVTGGRYKYKNYGYDGYSDMRTPWCYYPMDYHDRYCYMFPDGTGISWGMVYPVMYPEFIIKFIRMYAGYVTRWIIPMPLYPSQSDIEDMINKCYDMCKEMPELEEYAGKNERKARR